MNFRGKSCPNFYTAYGKHMFTHNDHFDVNTILAPSIVIVLMFKMLSELVASQIYFKWEMQDLSL